MQGQLIFDAADEKGIAIANRYVKKTGNRSAAMHFYVNDPVAFAKKTGTVLLEVRPFFTDARRRLRGQLKLYTRIAMWVADKKERIRLIHLKLNR